MLWQKIETEPEKLVHYFLHYYFPILFMKGFDPLCELVCMYYQDGEKVRHPYQILNEKYGGKVQGNLSNALKKGYREAPEFMEEIVRHSLDQAPGPIEFAKGAADWLKNHTLMLTREPSGRGSYYTDLRWLAQFSGDSLPWYLRARSDPGQRSDAQMHETILDNPTHFERIEFEYRGLHGDTSYIKTPQAAMLFQREVGVYTTLTTGPLEHIPPQEIICDWLAEKLDEMLKPYDGGVLGIFGIGNRDIASDSLGPKTIKLIPAQGLEHLCPEPRFRKVVTLCPGVTWENNMDTSIILEGIAAITGMSCALLIDSIITEEDDRLCNSIHLSSTGLRNSGGREQLNQSSIGIPILSVGVPMIVPAPSPEVGGCTRRYTLSTIDEAVDQAAAIISTAIIKAVYPKLKT